MLKCSVCGDEFNEDEKSCPGCGASVSGKGVGPDKSSLENHSNTKGSKPASKSANGNKNINSKSEPEKSISFSSTKLFYLILFLVLIGALLVYSSGVLDTDPPVTISSQQADNNNPHSGVDLQHLEQINSLKAAVDKDPNDQVSLLQLAHLYNDSGFKDNAIERYTQYLKMDPKNADVLVDMGVCYFETGKNKDAILAMESALKINPNHQIANLNLGIVNMTAGNKEKAIGYWNKAVEIDPTNEIGQKAKELLTTH